MLAGERPPASTGQDFILQWCQIDLNKRNDSEESPGQIKNQVWKKWTNSVDKQWKIRPEIVLATVKGH